MNLTTKKLLLLKKILDAKLTKQELNQVITMAHRIMDKDKPKS